MIQNARFSYELAEVARFHARPVKPPASSSPFGSLNNLILLRNTFSVQFSSSQSPAVAARVPAENPARIPIQPTMQQKPIRTDLSAHSAHTTQPPSHSRPPHSQRVAHLPPIPPTGPHGPPPPHARAASLCLATSSCACCQIVDKVSDAWEGCRMDGGASLIFVPCSHRGPHTTTKQSLLFGPFAQTSAGQIHASRTLLHPI